MVVTVDPAAGSGSSGEASAPGAPDKALGCSPWLPAGAWQAWDHPRAGAARLPCRRGGSRGAGAGAAATAPTPVAAAASSEPGIRDEVRGVTRAGFGIPMGWSGEPGSVSNYSSFTIPIQLTSAPDLWG
jgi:hypothetical protein